MFELKISTDAAVTLITERMQQEYQSRVKRGILHPDLKMSSLPYSILLDIAETSTMDLIFLLPVDVLMEKNNLSDIIVRTFRRLSDVLECDEFFTYTPAMARKLLSKTDKYFSFDPKSDFFNRN